MDKNYAKYLINKTCSDYNLIAEDFSRTRERIWEEIGFLFTVKSGEKVLDLGCGNARYYQLLKNADYIGVDNSKELIKIAKQKYPKVNFFVQDALNLSFENNFFDKIFNIAVLHHIPSQGLRLQFLKEAKRVLRPGGKLTLTVWKFHQKKERPLLIKYTILKIIGRSKLDFKDILEPWADKTERYYHWFSQRELKRLVKKAGFKIEKSGITKNSKGTRQNIYLIAEK